ncbi:MAG: HAD-IIB family hydrolase [Hyphomicrobium sp.]|nr:HAD-IIB family hydrolase [Hyphomicrobium sp.]
MQPLSSAPPNEFADVDYILTDLDDTITLDGRLPAASYAALEALEAAGKHVIIVTGRPAGWCDLLARFFPVSAVVGENGAFYFRYDRQTRIMHRAFQRTDAEREQDRARLDTIYAGILASYPNLRLSADQPYRVSDLAVDFCEDVERLDDGTIADIVRIFEAAGATAKVSSIHVNAWIGDFSKLEMSLRLLQDVYSVTPADSLDLVVYVGDSPNDEPMFGHFRHTVGVANLSPFLAHLRKRPAWITARPGGLGFAEVASRLLNI